MSDDWKSIAGLSSRQLAISIEMLDRLTTAAKKMADTIPDYWHDEATTEFRDALADADKVLRVIKP